MRVGRLAIVVETIASTEAHNFARKIVLAQAPAHDIECVDAVVAELAVAVLPVPMPLVMKAVRIKRPVVCGPFPKIVVDAGGHLRVGFFANAVALAIDDRARELHLPQFAGMQIIKCGSDSRGDAVLWAVHAYP